MKTSGWPRWDLSCLAKEITIPLHPCSAPLPSPPACAGCNELPKDTCNLLNRLLHSTATVNGRGEASRPAPASEAAMGEAVHRDRGEQGEAAGGQLARLYTEEEELSYSRHLADIIPRHDTRRTARAGGRGGSGRYSLEDLAVGCLTTKATYRSRGARHRDRSARGLLAARDREGLPAGTVGK